jgi:hypothetical protein
MEYNYVYLQSREDKTRWKRRGCTRHVISVFDPYEGYMRV